MRCASSRAATSPKRYKPRRSNSDTMSRYDATLSAPGTPAPTAPMMSTQSTSVRTGAVASQRVDACGGTTSGSPNTHACCAAIAAAKRPSAMPTPKRACASGRSARSASPTAACTNAASDWSPPTYRDGPRVAKTITPGVATSTSGTCATTRCTTGSNALRALRPSAAASDAQCGNRTTTTRVGVSSTTTPSARQRDRLFAR